MRIAHIFAKEHNVWLHQSSFFFFLPEFVSFRSPCSFAILTFAPRYSPLLDCFLHLFGVVWSLALDTSLCREAPMGFNYLACRDAGTPFECVYILGETGVQERLRC